MTFKSRTPAGTERQRTYGYLVRFPRNNISVRARFDVLKLKIVNLLLFAV